jgi:hypothetical protein
LHPGYHAGQFRQWRFAFTFDRAALRHKRERAGQGKPLRRTVGDGSGRQADIECAQGFSLVLLMGISEEPLVVIHIFNLSIPTTRCKESFDLPVEKDRAK